MKRDPEIQRRIESIDTPAAPDDFFDRLQQRLDAEPKPSKLTLDKYRIAAITTAVAAAFAGLIIGIGTLQPAKESRVAQTPAPELPTPKTTAPVTEIRPVLISDVLSRSVTAIGNITSVSGRIDTEFHSVNYPSVRTAPSHNTAQFGIRNNGDYFERGSNESKTYNAKSGRFVACSKVCDVQEGLIATDPNARLNNGLSRALETIQSAGSSGSSMPADTTEVDGKSAWQINVKYPDNLRAGPNGKTPTIEMNAVIDQETLLPLRVSTTWNGQPDFDVTITQLQVNQSIPDTDFDILAKRHVDSIIPAMFKRTSSAELERMVGYRPPQPANVPGGFTAAEVSYTGTSSYDDAESKAAYSNVAVVTYRRGIQSLTVEIRPTVRGIDYSDKFGIDESGADIERSRKTVTTGMFSGVNAYVDLTNDFGRVSGVGGKFVFSISGDLSRDALFSIAESLG